ncbi:NUDIX domain-containing protein [Ruania alba]|uniref:ADP-ribose pyrophosphatase YjhB, NUDIX family n=1 Tax=Ruania alba TaxID=648782 RepID=A0A1H5NA79_9MICO|nr:NUDIX hydrolase [Ruania alba]SEE97578.1 ADP-ribose pyrophosphatase YjhB, NUDIX family [Ruania alba]
MPDQPDPSRRPADWRPEGPWESWVECGCGARHWGRSGAAGLLILDDGDGSGNRSDAVGRVLLQHRATWTHHGDTWGVPGGALRPGESAWEGAVREAIEEAGVDGDALAPLATSVLTHPDWSYTTVLARATGPLTARPTDAESAAIEWVNAADVERLPLLPAFADAWPRLQHMLTQRPTLVVDAANVVGSRPDGWWKDRAGATRRLLARLEKAVLDGVPSAVLGLPGDLWWPDIVLVTEGAARAAGAGERVRVVAAPGEGDDEIVAQVRALRETGAEPVVVATADRELIARVSALGAGHTGPRTV